MDMGEYESWKFVNPVDSYSRCGNEIKQTKHYTYWILELYITIYGTAYIAYITRWSDIYGAGVI